MVGMMFCKEPVSPTAEVQKAERKPYAHSPFVDAQVLDNAISDKTTNILTEDISTDYKTFVHCCCCPKRNPSHKGCK